MEEQEKLQIGIGTKEAETLKPEPVKIVSIEIEPVKKDDKVIGEKAIFKCKHSQKEEMIKISRVRFVKGKAMEDSGTWFNLDEDKNIRKGSALAVFMNFFEVNALEDFYGKQVPTVADEKGYLCFKAY